MGEEFAQVIMEHYRTEYMVDGTYRLHRVSD